MGNEKIIYACLVLAGAVAFLHYILETVKVLANIDPAVVAAIGICVSAMIPSKVVLRALVDAFKPPNPDTPATLTAEAPNPDIPATLTAGAPNPVANEIPAADGTPELYEDMRINAVGLVRAGGKGGLSWNAAKLEMTAFVNQDPVHHIADYTWWAGFWKGNYQTRLYKTDGLVQNYSPNGYHGVYFGGEAYRQQQSQYQAAAAAAAAALA